MVKHQFWETRKRLPCLNLVLVIMATSEGDISKADGDLLKLFVVAMYCATSQGDKVSIQGDTLTGTEGKNN